MEDVLLYLYILCCCIALPNVQVCDASIAATAYYCRATNYTKAYMAVLKYHLNPT
jgi:hypothetical protein